MESTVIESVNGLINIHFLCTVHVSLTMGVWELLSLRFERRVVLSDVWSAEMILSGCWVRLWLTGELLQIIIYFFDSRHVFATIIIFHPVENCFSMCLACYVTDSLIFWCRRWISSRFVVWMFKFSILIRKTWIWIWRVRCRTFLDFFYLSFRKILRVDCSLQDIEI